MDGPTTGGTSKKSGIARAPSGIPLDRIPPQNLEAEQSVLGAILLENEGLAKAMEIVMVDDFYRDAHRRIFQRMLDLDERNEPIDLITLSDELSRKNELEAVGGSSYLAALVESVPTAANIRHHCRIVREKAAGRNLITTSTEIAGLAYEGGLEVDDLIDEAEKRIFELSEKRIRQSFVPTRDIIHDSIQMVENLYKKKELVTGVPSGFEDLDQRTAGFQPGDLIIVAGRPSMGKTAFCLNIAEHVGIDRKEPVAIFSLEMSKEQLVLRMLCGQARVNSQNVRTGYLSQNDWPKLATAAGKIHEAPIYIDDSANATVLEMRAKARRLKKDKGLSLIIVDYLQLMKGRAGMERREQEISDISRSLKALAKELKVPIIALSQLNRLVEQRRPPIPNLADLRESGAIEQDADVILFIYRPEVYDKENPSIKGEAEIHIGKQRNGPIGLVRLTFMNEYTRFENRAESGFGTP